MSQVNAPGGGIIDSGDKRIERKVVVATGGAQPTAPGGTGRLTNVAITREPGGIVRGVYEYTQGGRGDATYNQYGKRIELMGGSREVPIINHPNFKTLTTTQVNNVQAEVDKAPGSRKTSFNDPVENNLYQCLIRAIDYFIAPSLVARVSEIESGLPTVSGLCKIDSPSGVGSPGAGVWILTGINATPLGDKYEVTREYTYIEQPQAAYFLYE
jgi:hypothetical protein